MIAAMNEAERQRVGLNNTEVMRDYYEQQRLAQTHPDDQEEYPPPNAQQTNQQLEPTNIYIYNPQNPSQPIIVPQAAPHIPVPKPASGGNAQPPTQSGGNPLSGFVQGVERLFGGGGQQQQQQPEKMQYKGKTYYRHSDGKYYTTPP